MIVQLPAFLLKVEHPEYSVLEPSENKLGAEELITL
jgi:hypothetical protein